MQNNLKMSMIWSNSIKRVGQNIFKPVWGSDPQVRKTFSWSHSCLEVPSVSKSKFSQILSNNEWQWNVDIICSMKTRYSTLFCVVPVKEKNINRTLIHLRSELYYCRIMDTSKEFIIVLSLLWLFTISIRYSFPYIFERKINKNIEKSSL